jgi:adenylate cyclase
MSPIVSAGLKPFRTRRWLASLLVGILATALATLAGAGPLLAWDAFAKLGHLELSLLTQRLNAAPIRPSSDILLISIEEETPARLGADPNVTIVPRKFHARLTHGLRRAGANVLVFDLLFMGERDPEDDEAFRSALADAAPMTVVLACDDEPDKSTADPDEPTGWRYSFRRPVILPDPLPDSVMCASALAWDPEKVSAGAVLLRPDESTGEWMPHIALAAVLGQYHLPASRAKWDRDREEVTAGSLSWSCGTDGEIVTRLATPKERFERIEYSEALQRLADPAAVASFKGRIVIVGDFSGTDVKPTRREPMNGAEFHAHTINTLLLPASTQLAGWRLPMNIAWALLLAFLSSWFLSSLRWRVALPGLAAVVALALAVPYWALAGGGLWVYTVLPGLGVLLSLLITGVLATGFAGQVLPRHVRAGRPDSLTEEATVMFVDLKGSTPMVEKLGPQQASVAHGKLLSDLSHTIRKHGGEVERTMGDGMLALFRRPGKDHHALRAARAAKQILAEVEQLSIRWQAEYGLPAGVTIGIETGMVSGAVLQTGDAEEWSSFGLTVNTAARLQSACGTEKLNILLGPAAWAMVQHQVALRSVGSLTLKGIASEVPAYTLASQKDSCEA